MKSYNDNTIIKQQKLTKMSTKQKNTVKIFRSCNFTSFYKILTFLVEDISK